MAQSATAQAYTLYPVLWQQTAAEYRALCYQAFNAATHQLSTYSSRSLRKRHAVIVTDLDETILNNSYYNAQLIKDGKSYTGSSWKQWTDRAQATAVPGAVAFLQQAAKRGVHIYYISNRDTSEVAATIANLKALQLPDADVEHCIFRSGPSSKEARRQQVQQQHEIIMLLGDNLSDFTDAFEKKSVAERFTATDAAKANWGAKFIVLPNATYGDWLNALYDNRSGLSPAQKDSILNSSLSGIR